MACWVALTKKITVYVDEKELEQFDSKIPMDVSRSQLLRKLMDHYTYLKLHNLAEGIIVAKPMEGKDRFLVHLSEPYVLGNQRISAGNIVYISTADILKYNLELGDTVKLYPDDGQLP